MAERIVVIGATGGVGGALARRLAARGDEPFLIARDAARLAALAGELGAPHAAADATDPEALAAAIGAAGPRLGGLAYCVGSIPLKPLKRLTAADFLEAFRLNAMGAALAVQAAQPALAAGGEGMGGAGVVLFSSIAARAGFPNHAAIAAAKGAVEGLVVALGAELAPAIRVNAIAPSLMRTEMAAPLTANAQMAEAIAKLHPVPRLGTPEDAAALAAFLLSPEAGWISGQVIGADGGRATLRSKG
ncbi:SDR family NAD(P)-dependent oxidoreductase [Teichococcus aestuarii]|uniref:Short-chain dehydrogenase n=1 Tax=Teichococcus aestuarii TaxID=568898 RepID=A0A2U1V952_9PROT|nr:SDR family oxidoreductase [Pseudoroseomonas aestuarii]PWC30441.1 short-chain dehydrogenase [Pseudoroseomonas aestuarii]